MVVIEIFDEKEWKAQPMKSLTRMVRRFQLLIFQGSASERHHLATLKNDDAEDSGEEKEAENDPVLVKESKHIQSEKTDVGKTINRSNLWDH